MYSVWLPTVISCKAIRSTFKCSLIMNPRQRYDIMEPWMNYNLRSKKNKKKIIKKFKSMCESVLLQQSLVCSTVERDGGRLAACSPIPRNLLLMSSFTSSQWERLHTSNINKVWNLLIKRLTKLYIQIFCIFCFLLLYETLERSFGEKLLFLEDMSISLQDICQK